jgi:hypothetical protein
MLRMVKSTRILVAAVLLAGPGLVALAQFSPPSSTTTQPETPRPPSATLPTTDRSTTAPANVLPTPQSVLDTLINEGTPAPAATVAPSVAATNPALRPAVDATAPNEPKAQRIREGQFIWNRTGRLVKDDKTGTFLFAFDSDGKGMKDPPMALLPSHLLMNMEDASEKGTRPVKFKISGEVTEYRGKNFLYVRYMQAVRDLNQGIGG